jgi:C-terminal processing protease CtpA/Prc
MNKVLKVEFVEGGSQAESLGIRAGDVVASYDGTPVSSSGQLVNVVQQAAESGKEKIAIVIFRNGNEITLEGSPGKLGLNVEEVDTSTKERCGDPFRKWSMRAITAWPKGSRHSWPLLAGRWSPSG